MKTQKDYLEEFPYPKISKSEKIWDVLLILVIMGLLLFMAFYRLPEPEGYIEEIPGISDTLNTDSLERVKPVSSILPELPDKKPTEKVVKVLTPSSSVPLPVTKVYSGSQEELSRKDFIIYAVEKYELYDVLGKDVQFLDYKYYFKDELPGERRLEIEEFKSKLSYIDMCLLLSNHPYLNVVYYLPSGSRLAVTDYVDLTLYNWGDIFSVISPIEYSVWLGSKQYLVTSYGKVLSPRK